MSIFDYVLAGICAVWVAVAVFVAVRRKLKRRGCSDCGCDCRDCERQSRKGK